MAPFAAARPAYYTYYGYSAFINVLDYTSVVIPVTKVDKNVDKKLEDFKAVDEEDQKTQDTCKHTLLLSFSGVREGVSFADLSFTDDPEIYDGAHVSVQLMGHKMQEEKMLGLAMYVGEAIHGLPL